MSGSGHDLGHPAFGHAGEEALDREMRRYGAGFDHNRHALRIVEHFEQRYAAFRGLNLTFETREGLLKHSRELDPQDDANREYLPALRPLLEAQLIDPRRRNRLPLRGPRRRTRFRLHRRGRRLPASLEIRQVLCRRRPRASFRHRAPKSQRGDSPLARAAGLAVIDGSAAAVAASGADSPEAVRRLDGRVALLAPEGIETSRQNFARCCAKNFTAPPSSARKRTPRRAN